MSINGIELAAGQVWGTRDGRHAEVVEHDAEDSKYPWRVNTTHDSWWVTPSGLEVPGKASGLDLQVLLKTAPKAETLVDALAAHGEKTAEAVRAGVQAVGDALRGAPELKQTQSVFKLSVLDIVTLADGQKVKVATLHGGHTDHQYQGRLENSADLIAFSDPDVLSFCPHEMMRPTAELPAGIVEPAPSAPDILEAAAGHMRDRAATYDKPEGERSMAQTVAIFNLHHGTELTPAQGWHFMQVLKDVRLFTNTANPHRDSVDDAVAYAALKGEALLQGGAQ